MIINERNIEEMVESAIRMIINEVVYADNRKRDEKKKTIGLTYMNSQDGRKNAKANANTFDRLNTVKMDSDNADTYEVPLKGGIMSYNITDINGTEIMHYFKKKWANNQKVVMNLLPNFNYDNNDTSKKMITVLWLDDIRNPEEYFSGKIVSNALIRNLIFYNKNIFSKYRVNWVWVRNLKEFQNYVINNPMPELVSFDFDLKPQGWEGDFENGGDVAKWFVDYCRKNNLQQPMCYAHSANRVNGIPTLNMILGNTEEDTTSSYELEMDDDEMNRFFNRFKTKISYVIKDWMTKHKVDEYKFSGISIMPVDSSSNFNKKFVNEILSDIVIDNFEIVPISPELIKKDLVNLERDEEFIEKNKEFYNSEFIVNKPERGTVKQNLDRQINRANLINDINKNIIEINNIAKILLTFINNSKNLETLSNTKVRNLVRHYKRYVDLIRESKKMTFSDEITQDEHTVNKILTPLKGSKPASIKNRSKFLWNMVKPYLEGATSVDGKEYKEEDLCFWELNKFEIKKLKNSERLGLRNIYNVNMDPEKAKMVEEELAKIKGTILIVFDDNISGGATLSDVCYQLKKLGIEYILPITFGKMGESNKMRGLVANTPKNGYNFN